MPIVTLQGRITAEGKLEVEGLQGLPPGPVSVTIRTLDRRVGGGARDVQAGRSVDEAATEMASYDNLPGPDEH